MPDSYFEYKLRLAPVWWGRFGESSGTAAVDISGNANNGTYQGTPTLGTAGAVDDGDTAVTFDGAGTEYVLVSDSAPLDLGDGPLSYEIWFKRTNAAQHSGGLMAKGSGMPILLIDDTSLGSIDWSSRGVGGGSDCAAFVTDTTSWHHIVGTKALAGAWLLYLDGRDITVTVGTPTTTNNATGLVIGVDNGGALGSYVEGIMDEPAIYNVVLTPTQVATLYALGRSTRPTVSAAVGINTIRHGS